MPENTLDLELDAILHTLRRKAEEASHYNGHHSDPTGYFRDDAIKETLQMAKKLQEYVNKRKDANDPV